MGKVVSIKSAKAPGRNISEAERNTVAVKLRLDPETADAIAALASGWKAPKSYVVDIALRVLQRALDTDSEVLGGFEDEIGELYTRDNAH